MQIKLTNFVSISSFLYLCSAVVSHAPRFIMAKRMKTIAPVDSLSGMFGKRSHSLSGKAVIANVRKQGGAWIDGAPYMYFSVLTKSTASPNPNETVLAQRARFKAIAALTFARLSDPSKMVEDQQGFRNQSTYKTLRQYVWHIVQDEYDAANP